MGSVMLPNPCALIGTGGGARLDAHAGAGANRRRRTARPRGLRAPAGRERAGPRRTRAPGRVPDQRLDRWRAPRARWRPQRGTRGVARGRRVAAQLRRARSAGCHVRVVRAGRRIRLRAFRAGAPSAGRGGVPSARRPRAPCSRCRASSRPATTSRWCSA
jgi:hypothetical protein